jgi:hypothetical protein
MNRLRMLSLFRKCIELSAFPCFEFFENDPEGKALVKNMAVELKERIQDLDPMLDDIKVDSNMDLKTLALMVSVLELNIHNFPNLWQKDVDAYLQTTMAGRLYYSFHNLIFPGSFIEDLHESTRGAVDGTFHYRLNKPTEISRTFKYTLNAHSMTPDLSFPRQTLDELSKEDKDLISKYLSKNALEEMNNPGESPSVDF